MSVRLANVNYQYSSAGGQIRFPDWQLAQGAQALLLGESGCGKTTLLHLLAGLMAATSGVVTVAGQDWATLTDAQRDQWRSTQIGIIYQDFHLLQSLTVAQNVLLASTFLPKPAQVAALARLPELLTQLELAPFAERKPAELSRGQQQRVALARALLNQPKLLLADEPTASLDDRHAQLVIDLLCQQAQAVQATLVVATHDRRIRQRFTQVLELPSVSTHLAKSADSAAVLLSGSA